MISTRQKSKCQPGLQFSSEMQILFQVHWFWGRIHFLVAIMAKVTIFSCQLLASDHYQLLELSILPCHVNACFCPGQQKHISDFLPPFQSAMRECYRMLMYHRSNYPIISCHITQPNKGAIIPPRSMVLPTLKGKE